MITGNANKSSVRPGTTELRQVVCGLLSSWRLYLGLATLLAGIRLNFRSQVYLHDYLSQGQSFPTLSDLILDNIPLWDIGYVSDSAVLLAGLVFITFVLHKRKYDAIPFYLLLCGVFHLVRGVFIVLTPFGNPPMFDGTEGLFNGFSKYELGVYPSGHTGIAFMYFVLANDRRYRQVLFGCLLVIIAALFLARAHYSIDVLSGIFFAYAIKSYGEKYWSGMHVPNWAALPNRHSPPLPTLRLRLRRFCRLDQ